MLCHFLSLQPVIHHVRSVQARLRLTVLRVQPTLVSITATAEPAALRANTWMLWATALVSENQSSQTITKTLLKSDTFDLKSLHLPGCKVSNGQMLPSGEDLVFKGHVRYHCKANAKSMEMGKYVNSFVECVLSQLFMELVELSFESWVKCGWSTSLCLIRRGGFVQ